MDGDGDGDGDGRGEGMLRGDERRRKGEEEVDGTGRVVVVEMMAEKLGG